MASRTTREEMFPDRFADHWASNFDVMKFMKRHRLAASRVFADLHLGNTVMYQWIKKGKIPLSVYKAMIAKYAPAEAVQHEQTLTVFKNPRQPFLLPNALRDLTWRYDRQRAGTRFALEDGTGYAVIPNDMDRRTRRDYHPGQIMEVEEVEPSTATGMNRALAETIPAGGLPSPEAEFHGGIPGFHEAEAPRVTVDTAPPGPATPMLVQAAGTPAVGADWELMINLLVRMQQERNEWRTRALTSEHATTTLRVRAEGAEARSATLEQELRSYERQLEELTRPGTTPATITPAPKPEVVDRVQRAFERAAPSLLQELADLPKSTGALS